MNASDPVRRWANTACLLLALGILFLIPLRIMSYGYLPPDDALRHAAKGVSGKPWTEIILMRPDLTVDHHIGWHRVLGALHRRMGWDTDALVAFATIVFPLTFLLAGLPASGRRPEAWLAALLVSSISAPPIYRLMLARPFVFSMGMLLAVLTVWTREGERPRFGVKIAIGSAAIALSTWIHGSSWYLFPMVMVAFALSGRFRATAGLTASWVIGVATGAIMTGDPWTFLSGHLRHMMLSLGKADLTRMLVSEFQPSEGFYPVLVIVALILVILRIRNERPIADITVRDPLFVVAAMGWILSLKVTRFWLDWGQPAFTLWVARELAVLSAPLPAKPFHRIMVTGFCGVALFWITTADYQGRWTNNLTTEYIETGNPRLRGWIPDAGGVVYNDDMGVFYNTFFKNPHAPWRYILAYEPALMPPEDLEIYRKIQWNHHADKSYAPWVEKMKPGDRMILLRPRSSPPDVPRLEWLYGVTGVWIGRTPRTADSLSGLPPDVPAKPEATPEETSKR